MNERWLSSSVLDLVLLLLDPVINDCGPFAMGIVDDCNLEESCSIKVRHLSSEAISEIVKTLRLEAWESRVIHELSDVDELFSILSHCKESSDSLGHKELVSLSFVVSTHDVNELLSELEVS